MSNFLLRKRLPALSQFTPSVHGVFGGLRDDVPGLLTLTPDHSARTEAGLWRYKHSSGQSPR